MNNNRTLRQALRNSPRFIDDMALLAAMRIKGHNIASRNQIQAWRMNGRHSAEAFELSDEQLADLLDCIHTLNL